jgi:NAD(P)-dependent dehydrogenase (short-subunit alcohol dehydrogenase family)
MITDKIRNPLSLFDVRDKVAIITGASGSFGHACAVALGALGVKLLLASGTAEELEAVVKDVGDVGGEVASVVRRPDTLEDAEAILKAALDAYGRVDQLVVASGTNKAGFIENQSYEDWQRVMDANVRGPWLMAKAVGAYWIKQGIKGKVLLISSTRGRHGNFSGYTA